MPEFPIPAYETLYLQLPTGYNGRAIHNHTKQKYYSGYDKPIDLGDALFNGFVWRETPEGDYFWRKLHAKVTDGDMDDLPPLPDTD